MSAWGLSAARNIRSAAVQITKGALSGGRHMSKAEEFRQSRVLVHQSKTEKREASLHGPCAHLDASCGIE